MKQRIFLLMFGFVLMFLGEATLADDEDKHDSQILKVYELHPEFYHKAAEWVRIRDEIPDDRMVRISIRGFLASLGLGPEMLGKATFHIDPRDNARGPLLYINAPENLIKRMKAGHLQVTGTEAKLLKPKDLKLIARLRTAQEERNALKQDPFATEKHAVDVEQGSAHKSTTRPESKSD